jgi:anti-anti-sigma regulatory factor
MTEAMGQVAKGVKVIDLANKLDVRGAVQLKSELTAALEDASHFTLNGSAVTKMSTAACQVLSAFIISQRAVGGRAQITTPSPHMSAAFLTLGMGSFLEEEA